MEHARPTVSVVIPCYNSAKTLEACLRALHAQSYPPLEIVVADDRSTDDSREIAARHGCVVVPAEVNTGPSGARNRGVAASSGDVLFFLDSDVALEPDAIANAVRLLESEPDLGCVHGMYTTEPLNEDGFIARYRLLHSRHWHERHAGRVRTAFFALAAMPRRVFDEVGPFDENLRESEDVEYSDRLHPRFGILLTDSVQGSHDDETALLPLLRTQFKRAQLLVPVALVERGAGRGGVRANRFSGVATAGLAVAALPFGLVWTEALIVAAAMVGVFAVVEPSLSRYVLRERGPGFLVGFTAVHFLLHLAIVAGASVGALRFLVDKDFGPSRLARPRWLGRAVTVVVTAVVLAFVLWALRSLEWSALADTLGDPAAPPLLGAAVAANTAGLVLAMLGWRSVLVDSGPRVGVRDSARIFFVGMVTKLVPGRVWAVLTHVRYGKDAGITPARMVAVYLLNIPIGLLTAAVVGLLAVPADTAWAVAVPAAVAVAVFVWPDSVNRLSALTLRLARRERPDRFASPRAVRASIGFSLVSWLVSGLHLWALAVLFGADPGPALPVCVGGFALAMLVGSLVVVVPDGIGAREVVLALPLATILPWPSVAAVLVLSRIAVLVSELLAAGVSLLAAGRAAAPADGGRTVLADR
ncbi:glycosyltransferase [Actinokineospora sp. UTMC 2448]|uniref:glycosyltransferase n=1 Tax=Actinokineospora sp. UTMC 2448 TaxID=2268449 RepID=UPI002164B566|nr:glycosyltransferase [Actinokineospora sp. UTMC 2448]UVS78812.1 Poly-beta-1,6-N-acetyl-D-glucosamine synthase [Actinokineospora sp. UTMC 2448]